MMKNKCKKICIIIIFALLLYSGHSLYDSKYRLSVSYYELTSKKIDTKIRIVHLSDLHGSVFGTDNVDIIKKVEYENPNVIFITGDLVNSKEEFDLSVAVKLIKNLSNIADVYFSFGNHEIDFENRGIDIQNQLSEAGAVVLNNEYIDTEINGMSVRVGGIYGYCQPEAYAQETERYDEIHYLEKFQNNKQLKLLLCHMPVCWIDSGSLYDWDVDCIFAGHAHGGQIQIPFVGGLWAPDQGWFPGKEFGIYTTNEVGWTQHNTKMIKWAEENGYDSSYYDDREYSKSTLILSRGLGSTEKIPRFNNVPEIVVVDLVPEED